jgi:hypothetical protein
MKRHLCFNQKEKRENKLLTKVQISFWLCNYTFHQHVTVLSKTICILSNQFGYRIVQLEDELFHACYSCL